MSTWHQSSEREVAARKKLYNHIQELRASLLDLLEMVDDRPMICTDVPMPEPERLRRAAATAEHRAHKIRRARSIIDGTQNNEALAGKLPDDR